MIDNLSILLSHALLLYVFYQLMLRDDVDHEGPPPPMQGDDGQNRFRPIKPGQKRDKVVHTPRDERTVKPTPVPRFRRGPKPVGRRGDA